MYVSMYANEGEGEERMCKVKWVSGSEFPKDPAGGSGARRSENLRDQLVVVTNWSS